jgi:RNA polymerase sigma factor (sigma-70 family)
VSPGPSTEDLLRELAPQVLGVVVRRHGDFGEAEDATQEALVAAATQWSTDGIPENPLGWLVRVASRRLVDAHRRDDARRRREALAGSWSIAQADPSPGRDDTLVLMFMCCHPALTPASAIPLTLRAVGGLSTREIATAFLVPEATMAQRISRAKAKVGEAGATFALPAAPERTERLRSVLHVLYLLFNEGYATSAGPDLSRTDLSVEAIRLVRAVRGAVPDDPEVGGLLALMLLTEARRPARTNADGELIPLAEQDRSRWDADLIAQGLAVLNDALAQGSAGEYQLQACISAAHDRAASHETTDWAEIYSLYGLLERMADNPMVTLNRAVAAAMAHGPDEGLELLASLDDRLGDHQRLHAVRAHLLEMAGEYDAAVDEFRAAAARATNQREQQYLVTQAARLTAATRG